MSTANRILLALDLDGTLADSRHRQHPEPDLVTADEWLDYWRHHNTASAIVQDKPLHNNVGRLRHLLAKYSGAAMRFVPVIFTARVVGPADMLWCKAELGEFPVLARHGDSDDRPDSILKADQLRAFLRQHSREFEGVCLWDDKKSNHDALRTVSHEFEKHYLGALADYGQDGMGVLKPWR